MPGQDILGSLPEVQHGLDDSGRWRSPEQRPDVPGKPVEPIPDAARQGFGTDDTDDQGRGD